ncbi:MAG: PDZ domain-containing protein [Gemmatimonadales bacterium]
MRTLRWLGVAGLLWSCQGVRNPAVGQGAPDPPGPRAVRLDGSPVIPLVAANGPAGAPLPVVEVLINGKGPFRFGVETGAAVIGFRPGLADSLRLTRESRRNFDGFRADSITMPGAGFLGVPVVELPRAAAGVDGILGLPFFFQVLFTIDYPRRTLTLSLGRLPEPEGREVLALGRVGPFFTVPLTIGGLETSAVLDTRSSGTVGLVPATADSVRFTEPLRVVGTARGVAIAATEVRGGVLAGDIRIGRYRFPGPFLVVRSLPSQLPQAAVLGSGALRHFAVTLDQGTGRLRLTRDGPADIVLGPPGPTPAPGGEPRRLGAALGFLGGGERIRVELVQPGSLAETIGLRVGDEITAINDRPVAELTQESLAELIRSPVPVVFRLLRAGSRLDLALPGR